MQDTKKEEALSPRSECSHVGDVRFGRGAVSIIAFAFFVGILSQGCAEDPSEVGVGILPPSDLPVFFVDTLYATASSSFYAKISTSTQDPIVPTWVPSTLLLGQRQTLVSGTYVRFHEFPDTLQGITITSAELVLFSKAVYGDSLGLTVGQYSVYRGRGTWTGDSLTYDSLDAFPGAYADLTPRPAASGAVRSDSSIAVALPIDPALVEEWFTITIDTSTNNQGMFLTHQAVNTIWGFWSFAHPATQYYPMLRISYTKNGLPGSYEHRKGFSRYLAKIPEGDLIQDPAKLYVQTGIAYRSRLTFDLSSLPIPVSVNSAKLLLSLDSSASDISIHSTDSLLIFAERSTGSIEEFANGLGVPISDAGRRVYDFTADLVFQTWQNSSTQRSLIVAGLAENATLTRFVFHGPSAAYPLKPMLIITYSKVLSSGQAGGSAR